MNKGLIRWLFGLIFNITAVALLAGILVALGSLRGEVDTRWVGRMGVILQVLGILLLVLDYTGVVHEGQSPLRWWLRRLGRDPEGVRPALWPMQAVTIVGVGALLLGLLLQLASSWQV